VRRVAPFPPDISARVNATVRARADAPLPHGVGRRIVMPG
jgi:acyl-CoA thioester hydrolase